MNSYNYNHYYINHNNTGWTTGAIADATAITILGLLEPEILIIVMYSLQEGYSINYNKILIKLVNN